MNKYRVPPPVDIPDVYLGQNSFINMLFNDEYNLNNYEYLYNEETNPFCIPRIAFKRLQVYPGSSKYLILDSTNGSNVFDLQQDDFTMLDALLVYRNDSTALTIVDSTSVNLISDATSGIYILNASYNYITTELARMIYLYLILKVQNRYEEYNNNSVISTGGLLETCYESYLIDQYFCFMMLRNSDLIYNCT